MYYVLVDPLFRGGEICPKRQYKWRDSEVTASNRAKTSGTLFVFILVPFASIIPFDLNFPFSFPFLPFSFTISPF